MKKIQFSAFALILLASCSQNESFEAPEASKEIHAVASIEGNAKTRTLIEGADIALSGLTFLRIDDSNTALSTYNFSSATEITNSSRAVGGVITFGTAQEYDKTADKTTYMCGYTTAGLQTGGATGATVWKIDGATDILLTDVWNAGRYSLPGTNLMTFRHQLSRIEVICQGEQNVAAAVVQSAWGKVQSIKLSAAQPEMTYTHATDKVTFTGTPTDFALLNGAEYDATKALTAFDIPAYSANPATIHAAAMVAPQATKVKLKITTAKQTEIEVETTLAALERVKKHVITLTFKSDAKTIECKSSTIEEWGDGNTGEGDVVKPKP